MNLDDLDRRPPSGAQVLGDVFEFLGRFVSYPSKHAHVAHTLWIAHTWLMDCWESTPRIAFLSPEPGSGKSRCLEVTAPLVPRPVHAVNVSTAYLFRKISDEDGRPVILYDEIDTVFNPKRKNSGENEDVRGLLNAGHRTNGMVGRCEIRGKSVVTVEYPAYSAVALAGLDDLPDTLMTRSVIIRMRRRAPHETVEPWRGRLNEPEGYAVGERLAEWARHVQPKVTWPDMPPELQDRNADVWEALLAVADVAGGTWPELARVAAVALVALAAQRPPSIGVLLLRDLRRVFKESKAHMMATRDILDKLNMMLESPWGTIRGGEPLNERGLAERLRKYEVSPKNVRVTVREHGVELEKVLKGYDRTDLYEPWSRYLPPETEPDEDEPPIASPESATSATSTTAATPQLSLVPNSTTGQLCDEDDCDSTDTQGIGAYVYCRRHAGSAWREQPA